MHTSAFLRLALVLYLPVLGGCQLFILGAVNAHHMTLERATAARELRQIAVVDVQTDAPIAGARLHLVYNFDWLDDWGEDRLTNAQGIADVKVAIESIHLLSVSVRAEGYYPQSHASLSGFRSEQTITILLRRQNEEGLPENTAVLNHSPPATKASHVH